MPTQNIEPQKAEDNKESLVRKTALDTTSKTFSTGIVEGGKIIISLIITSSLGTSLIAFFAGLPVYFYIPLGVIVLFLGVAIWYLLSLQPKNKILEAELEFYKEKEREKNEIEKLKEQIETLKSEHRREIDNQQETHRKQIYGHRADIKRLNEIIEKNYWLTYLYEKQKNKIMNYISIEPLELKFEMEIYPRIILPLKVYDWSIFDVTLEDERPKGKINVFVDDASHPDPFTFSEKPSYKIYSDSNDIEPFLSLEKLKSNPLVIEQRLSESDINNLNRLFDRAEANTKQVMIFFDLIIEFKVREDSNEEFPAKIKLQDTEIISKKNFEQ